jgi:hypothetical protein
MFTNPLTGHRVSFWPGGGSSHTPRTLQGGPAHEQDQQAEGGHLERAGGTTLIRAELLLDIVGHGRVAHPGRQLLQVHPDAAWRPHTS